MPALYQHKQSGGVILSVLGFGAAVCLWLASTIYASDARLMLFIVAAILGISALLFSSLTIELSDMSLSWRFGFGLLRKKVPTGEIINALVTRTSLLDGWGVHRTRNGWLYNVSGFGAVQVILRSGKSFLLGSDEPERLCSALKDTISSSEREIPRHAD
jgi:hypothetical protein